MLLSKRALSPILTCFCADPSQVTGGSGRSYTCLVSCHYCPCPVFSYNVLRRNDGLLVSLFIYACGEEVSNHQWAPCWRIQGAETNSPCESSERGVQQMRCRRVRTSSGHREAFFWLRPTVYFHSEHLRAAARLWSRSSSEEDPRSLEDAAKISVRN